MVVKEVDLKKNSIEEIIVKYNVDKDLLSDVKDESEMARFLEKEGFTEIILKYPTTKGDVKTLGAYVRKDDVVFIYDENPSFNLGVSYNYTNILRVIVDVIYKISEQYFKSLKNIDKKMRKIKSSSKSRVKNSDLLAMFELQNTLDDYVMGLKGNISVLNKIMTILPQNEFVNDTKIECDQALETAISYSKTVSNLKSTLEIITNNLTNKRMESLTIVNVSALIITSMSGLYGMNVELPFANKPNVFYWLLAGSVCSAIFVGLYLNRQFSNKK